MRPKRSLYRHDYAMIIASDGKVCYLSFMSRNDSKATAARTRPVTLADIGREAGVSFSIVSRVLRNREDRIPEATRNKVWKAAEVLGYRRNLLIRGVQTGRSMNIGVVIPSTGSYYSEIVHGIHDEFRKHEYCIVLAWNSEEMAGPDSKQELDLIHSLVDRRVDGIILRPTHADVSNVYFSEVLQRNIPMVTVDRPLPGVTCDFSGTDDERGACLATRHLLEAGHRRLVHVAVASSFEPARLRRAGFEMECAAVKGTTFSTIQIKGYDETGLVISEVDKVLRRKDRPTALFLASDNLAPWVYRTARRVGLKIPDDLSVVGFGNTEVGEWLEPRLTSIDQSPRQMGENAARMIIDRIRKDGGEVTRILSNPALVERDSVARR